MAFSMGEPSSQRVIKPTYQRWSTFVPNNEFGDFQTPPQLAQLCLKRLDIPQVAVRVLEPACGLGSFLHAASQVAPDSEREDRDSA